MGDELTNFKFDEFKIRSEEEEIDYVSMFRLYNSQLTKDAREFQLNQIKKKYENTKCPSFKSSKYIFFDH